MLSIIVAMAANRVIGRDNDLPWRLPADFKYFKLKTVGKPCVMARKTFESLGGALKNRPNIVLTRDRAYSAEGAIVVHTIDEALAQAEAHRGDAEEIMILGGATLYEAILPQVDRMYITLIHEEFEGDTRFPEFDLNDWVEVWREDHEPDEKNKHRYSFTLLERR
ncbi:MAG: dihydrofolate reductase [Candidatus Kapaibacterium sp.]